MISSLDDDDDDGVRVVVVVVVEGVADGDELVVIVVLVVVRFGVVYACLIQAWQNWWLHGRILSIIISSAIASNTFARTDERKGMLRPSKKGLRGDI